MGGGIVPAAARSGRDIDLIATKVIRRFQPELLKKHGRFDIEQFFELDLNDYTGIDTRYERLPPGIHGVTDSERMTSSVEISLVDEHANIEFARSTIAHECGHAIIHVPEFRQRKAILCSIQDKDDVSLKMYRKDQVVTYRNPEWQAHRFAGALLVPEITLRSLWEQCREITILAGIYGVTAAFMRSRLKALKMI
jgi:hypothetical protein